MSLRRAATVSNSDDIIKYLVDCREFTSYHPRAKSAGNISTDRALKRGDIVIPKLFGVDVVTIDIDRSNTYTSASFSSIHRPVDFVNDILDVHFSFTPPIAIERDFLMVAAHGLDLLLNGYSHRDSFVHVNAMSLVSRRQIEL